jgi:steroid delta-isomerase-like uncharacterized protein
MNVRTEQHKAIARQWSEELWGRGNLAVADQIIAPDYVRHDPGDPFPARGPDDVKRIVTMLRAMLPDLTIEVEDLIAEGDKVAVRYTGIATDSGGYMGHPPTGKTTHTAAIQVFRFAGDKIVESWAVRDDLGVLRQLGHVPPAASNGHGVAATAPTRRVGWLAADAIDHVAYNVPDLDEAVAFFTEALGCELLARGGPVDRLPGVTLSYALMRFDAAVAFELLEWRGPNVNTRLPSFTDVGGGHLAVVVPDLAAAEAALASQPGVRGIIAEDLPDGRRFVRFETPWGMTIQLLTAGQGASYYAAYAAAPPPVR